MSPEQTRQSADVLSFPRVSGDEPPTHPRPRQPQPFSPRERG